jgi:hypothetical protein
MSDPADMIVPLLREMRAENLEQHEQTRALVMALDKRLGGVECGDGTRKSEDHK